MCVVSVNIGVVGHVVYRVCTCGVCSLRMYTHGVCTCVHMVRIHVCDVCAWGMHGTYMWVWCVSWAPEVQGE